MSVLEQLRSGSDSSFMQVVMFVVVLSFIFWYASPQGDQANVVAQVNGEKIMSTEYGREFRNYQRYEENRLQRTLSNEEQEQLGEQVKDFLIDRELIRQGAEDLGITVSDDEVADRILNDAANKGADGKFDMKLFERQLKYAQLTREAYEAKLREQLRQEKVMRLVQMGATVSEPVVRRAWRDANTKVDIEYIAVREFSFLGDVNISDAERSAWLAENELMAKERYDADLNLRYDHPAQIRVRMVRLVEQEDGPRISELKATLQGVADAVGEGADFAEMAAKWSEDPTASAGGDRGLRPVEQYDPKELEVLEGVEPGQMTRVFVLNGTEVRLYLLEERTEPRVDDFMDVRDQIAEQIMTQERLPVLAVSFAEETLLPAWKEAASAPEELAASKNLSILSTGPLSLQGMGGLARPPEDMMRVAESLEVGTVFPEVYEKDGAYWVGQLNAREEPDESTYEDQKEMLRGQALQARRQSFFGAWVADRKASASILR